MSFQINLEYSIPWTGVGGEKIQKGRSRSVLCATSQRFWLTAIVNRLVFSGLVGLICLSGVKLMAASANEPSIVADLPAKNIQPLYDLAADAKRKALMSPEEAAWETVLEQNLGDFYLPLYKRDKLKGAETPWDFVKDDPKLPRVLLIGDSISRGYTLAVRHALAGRVNVHRAPANCGSTAMGLKHLPAWLGDGKWNLIHFNFGIWNRNTDPAIYAANLEQIVTELQQTKAKLIWASTTPPASSENAEKYLVSQCEELNRVADRIMKENGIPINDLCSLVQPRLAELQLTNNVHFNAAGYKLLGSKVVEEILAALDSTAVDNFQPGTTDQTKSQHKLIGVAAESIKGTIPRSDNHWFRRAGMGIFIHWGLASIPGNTDLSWGMMKNTPWDAEFNNQNKLAPAAYLALAPQFNPTNFCPDRWLKAAQDAGFGYAVFTTRHHDGFALWPSKYGDFNVGKFQGRRDLVREYVEACRKVGMKVGFYYSPPDWYRERNYMSWGYGAKGTPESPYLGLNWETLTALPQHPPGFHEQYIAYVNGQITDLLTQYGPIDYLWFDGSAGPEVLSQDQIRKLQPNIIINDRQHGFGDVMTSGYEYHMPKSRPAGWWEYCFSMVGAWGYTKPENYKPTSLLIERIAQAWAIGGNVLANYGPRPDGEMPEAFYKQMAELKKWHEQTSMRPVSVAAGEAGKPFVGK